MAYKRQLVKKEHSLILSIAIFNDIFLNFFGKIFPHLINATFCLFFIWLRTKANHLWVI